MSDRPKLSSTATARRWLKQFPAHDKEDAERLLDYLLLVSETEVSRHIADQLRTILPTSGRVALYGEREITTKTAFPIETYVDGTGTTRQRAVASARFQPVQPRRGATRVGSEGWIAFLISQVVASDPRFVNAPSPQQYRSKDKAKRIRDIVVVTDFIASGDRIHDVLESFWQIPTFAAWWSRKWVRFHVVAAVTTARGRTRVLEHPCKPKVWAPLVSQVLKEVPPPNNLVWEALAITHGPPIDPLGYKATGALVAFEYGFPNNVPAILAERYTRWRPLFRGRAPADLHEIFTGEAGTAALLFKLAVHGLKRLGDGLNFQRKRQARLRNVAFLAALRGRWHKDSEIEVAGRSGMQVSEVLEAREVALKNGWINAQGRITDEGRRLMRDAERGPRRRQRVAKPTPPYYPHSLRVP